MKLLSKYQGNHVHEVHFQPLFLLSVGECQKEYFVTVPHDPDFIEVSHGAVFA